MKNRKILIYSLIVFILAGMIVILLKGFNVNLMLRKHDSIEYVVGTGFEIKDIEEIAKEQLNGKEVKIRIIEVFDDAVSINSLEITEDEKNNIVNKLNDKYSNQIDVKDVKIISNPGLRVRQIVKPYIIPTIISVAIIYISYCIRFYKSLLFSLKIIVRSIIITLILDLTLLSLIAIVRIPFSTITIPVIIFMTIFSIILYFVKEKNNIINEIKMAEK